MLIGLHLRMIDVVLQAIGLSFTENGPLISWKSRKQPTVDLFICEGEYLALLADIQ